MEIGGSTSDNLGNSSTADIAAVNNTLDLQSEDQEQPKKMEYLDIPEENPDNHPEKRVSEKEGLGNRCIPEENPDNHLEKGVSEKDQELPNKMEYLNIPEENPDNHPEKGVSEKEGLGNRSISEENPDNHLEKGISEKDQELPNKIEYLNIPEENPDNHPEKGVSEKEGLGNRSIPEENPDNHLEKGESEKDQELPNKIEYLNIPEENPDNHPDKGVSEKEGLGNRSMLEENPENHPAKGISEEGGLGNGSIEETQKNSEEVLGEEKEAEPVFDGTEVPDIEVAESSSSRSIDLEPGAQGPAWPEKAVALKNFVKERGAVAVSTVFRRLSGKRDEDGEDLHDDKENDENLDGSVKEEADSKEGSQKPAERSAWNLLSFIKIARDSDFQNKAEQQEGGQHRAQEPAMKGRVILYTRLGCQNCREIRSFLHQKGIKYVEINIDIFPSRKVEIEKNTGSSAVPKLYFNDLLVEGLSELKTMDESGKLAEKMNDLINEEPSSGAPLPPLSGEDDMSGSGVVDELALIVRKMRESIEVKDRFCKMRRFSNCFLGSEAVDFLSEDHYLEREKAIKFGRKLGSQHFFQHVLDENVFEDGNQLYRFLDSDPIVMTQCYNIPRGTIDVKPKSITEIASRLRFLMFAMFEAYVSEDGRHVDYRSIQGSEEFARYLRIVEELQRVDLQNISREEKLAFFINLYNMMAIHAILTWGYPLGPLDRRKLLGDFKYVIGGSTYSLSAILNGILRANQRPPYNLIKPFGPRDKRAQVALPYPEPLVHFALVSGHRSGPALRCYSPSDIDNELMEVARNFMGNGGVVVDVEAKVAYISKILRWYSVDFGKNEMEVLKHASNYLEVPKSEELLEFLANTQLKVVYQPFDWSLNS